MNNKIKMFINDEEVVSQNEYTINEEMLSASSTILNNCYPKSWEVDQDYISKFYYPKDYSKFILAQGGYEHGNEEYSILNAQEQYEDVDYSNIDMSDFERNYTLVDYVETNNHGNYISTGFYATKNTKLEICYKTIGNFSQNPRPNFCIIAGSYDATNNKGISIGCTINTTGLTPRFDGKTFEIPISTDNTILTDISSKDGYYRNGTRIKNWGTTNEFTTNYPITLFTSALPSGNVTSWQRNARIYYCKIYENDELVRDMIPCIRKSDNEIGFYDLVNEAFYTNQGNGTFAYGSSYDYSFITNMTKEVNNFIVYGKTDQQTAPEEFGKNLLYLGNVPTAPNITVQKIDNSSIKINGTTNQNINLNIPILHSKKLELMQYCFSVYLSASGSKAFNVILQPFSSYNLTVNVGSVGVNRISVPNYSAKPSAITLQIPTGTIFNNAIISFQLEEGTQSTSFEPATYVPPMPSVDRPSALNSVGYSVPDSKYQIKFENIHNLLETDTYLYTFNSQLRGIGEVKDRLYIENNKIYIERNIGHISIYNGETISTDYMSTTGGLNTGAEVQYVLSQPYIEELSNMIIPIAYTGANNIKIDTGLETDYELYYYWRNYNVLFSGIVKNSGDISLNPRYPHYCSLQILDYKTFLSESDTLDYVISNKTIKEAIEMVISSVSNYGFIEGNIDISSADEIIGAYSTLNKTAYDVFQYLADISGSRWRTRYIDSDTMAIDFYDPNTLPQADDFEYTKEYWENNNIVDLTFSYGTRDYRNKQIILSDEIYASISYTEVLLSNGYNTNFIVQQNVGIVISITVNGVEKDVVSQKEKELGVDADFYYTVGKNIIESSNSYTAGTQIAITYIPLVKGRQIVYNNEEVTRIATQTNTLGVISRYENRNDIVSSKELQQIAETYIEYKGKAEIILTLTTQNKNLYDIGEVAYFNLPIPELQQKYMVKSKKTEYVVINKVVNLFYVYELTSSFNSERAINYFDNQRNKAQGNIQEGQSITRNIDINNSAVIIWDNPTVEEITVTVDGNNALNSVLNSPFIE